MKRRLWLSIGFTLFLLCCTVVPGLAQSPHPATLTPDEAHAWRLHDQYLGVMATLSSLERERALLGRDVRQDSQAGVSGGVHVVTSGYAREMARLNARIADLQRQAQALEQAWTNKFGARFGPLSDARQIMVDPATKRSMDKIAFRLTNFSFDPNTPKPVTQSPPPGHAGGAPAAGIWTLTDIKTVQVGAWKSPNTWSGKAGAITVTYHWGNGVQASRLTFSATHRWQMPHQLRPGSVVEIKGTIDGVTYRQHHPKLRGYNMASQLVVAVSSPRTDAARWMQGCLDISKGVFDGSPDVRAPQPVSGVCKLTVPAKGPGDKFPLVIKVICGKADMVETIYTYTMAGR